MHINTKETLVLSSQDVQVILERYGLNQLMDLLIHNLEKVIYEFNSDKNIIPKRSGFNYEKPNTGLVEWMPVYEKEKEVIIKVVGYHPKNPHQFNLPTILSTISSYDTTTGHLTAIVDGVLLTALRTGAASAIASKYMASPNSSILGLIGCGAQAVTQLHAISRVFDIEEVLYFDTDASAVESFVSRCSMMELNLKFTATTIEEIVTSSHIISTMTSIEIGEGPLFTDLSTNPKLHINAVGSDFPGKIELPLEFLQNSIVCPDFKEQAQIEGECQQLESKDVGPELVTVIQNSAAFEYIKDKCSVFDSTGWALEDQVVINLFIDLATKLGIGEKMVIENISEDAKNPYHFMLKEIQVPL